jgi:hypothetical protein
MYGYKFDLEPVCSWSMTLDGRVSVGDSPEGFRVAGYLKDGAVDGPRISGKILRGGVDWAYVRPDGILVPEVKLAIETHDGAIIEVRYEGVVDMGSDAYARIRNGERPGPVFDPRTAIRMVTASADYAWVNRRQFVGIGFLDYDREADHISYDVYEITIPRR